MKNVFALLFVLAISMVACKEEEENTSLPDEKIILEVCPDTPLSFDSKGGDEVLEVKTNAESYTAESGDITWCRVITEGSELTVKVFPNETTDNRNSFVRVVAGDGAKEVSDTIFVKQAGVAKCAITAAPAVMAFEATSLGEQVSHCSFTLGNANDEVVLSNAGQVDWIQAKLDNMDKETGTVDVIVNVDPNTSSSEREYDLIVTAGTGVGMDADTIHINQNGVIPVNLSYTLEPEVFAAEGGELVLKVKMEPETDAGFTYRWENEGEEQWISIDDSQKEENILVLKTDAYDGEQARTANLILETLGAEPCIVELRQMISVVQPGDYKLGDIVKNQLGDAVGIVVKEKTTEPGLIMSLKTWRTGSFFTRDIQPELVNSKDGEENTNNILATYSEADCPGLYTALNEMSSQGETGWFLPSPDNMWDAMSYFTGIDYDRTVTDDFAYNWGTEGYFDEVQFNKANRLIEKENGDTVDEKLLKSI